MIYKLTDKDRKAIVARLRRAAETVFKKDSRGCCLEIEMADPDNGYENDGTYYKTKRLFGRMFEKGAQALDHDFAYYFEDHCESYDSKEVRNRRAQGLLFCAYLIEIGEWS